MLLPSSSLQLDRVSLSFALLCLAQASELVMDKGSFLCSLAFWEDLRCAVMHLQLSRFLELVILCSCSQFWKLSELILLKLLGEGS